MTFEERPSHSLPFSRSIVSGLGSMGKSLSRADFTAWASMTSVICSLSSIRTRPSWPITKFRARVSHEDSAGHTAIISACAAQRFAWPNLLTAFSSVENPTFIRSPPISNRYTQPRCIAPCVLSSPVPLSCAISWKLAVRSRSCQSLNIIPLTAYALGSGLINMLIENRPNGPVGVNFSRQTLATGATCISGSP